jgi:HlyD family secretion protein
MLNFIKQLFGLLTPSQRKRFYVLQTLVVLMSFTEILGVASIIPFMTLVGDMDQLQQDTMIAQVFKFSSIESETQFVFIIGIFVLIMLIISATISMFTVWRLSMFANKIGAEIADKLYTHYLKQGWLFHAAGSSAQLTKKIATETLRVTSSLLTPLMLMNAKIGLIILMVLSLFFYDPFVAVVGFSFFGMAYFLLYKVVRMRLQQNGKNISEVNEKRFRLMNEGFGGIKDILLLGRDEDFIKRFNEAGQKLAYSMGANVALGQVPRYFMELVAFGSMIGLLLYLITSYESDLGRILPILSVYAFASIKLLPAFQQVYASTANIKGNIAALESIQSDLINAIRTKPASNETKKGYIVPKKEISLENITFNYPTKEKPTLNQLSMSISANSTVGIVGPSGSGKSTLIDIILGLIKPQHGDLKVDGEIINNKNNRIWQNTIGFVAQSIFLSEGTIAENVAFGIPKSEIDQEQVLRVLKQAHLSEFLDNLGEGINTKVGERGVQLSGGQRQRIGIARALYHKAEVLVLDEATSSLDGITEKKIMKALQDLKNQKTIILIAHRLKTVQKCDEIFFISDGHLVDRGSYDELIIKNDQFKRMALHS